RGRARALFLIAAVFLLGAGCGALGAILAARRALLNPPAGGFARARILREMTRDLRLDPRQRAKVAVIVDDARRELLELADRSEPEVRAILERARERIRPEHTPQQQARFGEEVRRRLERMRRIRAR